MLASKGRQTRGPIMYHSILLAYDGSREGRLALREGARLAQVCGASVTLVAVVDPTAGMTLAVDPAGLFIPPDQTETYQKILDEGAERLSRMGLTHSVRLERGQPVERIAAVAEEVGADLVVVGHAQQGVFARWLLGSVTADLVDQLHCTLLVARMEISDETLFAAAAERPAS